MSVLSQIGFSTGTIGLFAVLGFAHPAHAAIINGNFSSGLNNWLVSGDVSTTRERALLTTASSVSEDDFSTAGTPFNFSGDDVTPIANLETFLGVNPFDLDPTGSFFGAFEGSAVKQTFTANSGDSLNLEWNFFTNEDSSSAFFANDTAFLALANTTEGTSQIVTLADLSSSLTASSSSLGFTNETGTKSFSQVLTPGDYVLGLTVVDDVDSTISSALLVDNVRLSNGDDSRTTPEPATVLALIGTFLLGNKIPKKK